MSWPAPPKWQHDCDSCVFIAHFQDHDIYRCPQEIAGFGLQKPTIVARFGNDPGEYESGKDLQIGPLLYIATETSYEVHQPDIGLRVTHQRPTGVRDMTTAERERFYTKNECPFCGSDVFHLGPRGGMCQNITCTFCEATLNVDPVGLAAEVIRERLVDENGEPINPDEAH